MNRLKIGVRLESLGLPLRRGLAEAGRLGVPGVQLDAVGDLAPNNLSQSGRRELRHLLRGHNLELAALGCPLRRGLDVAEDQQPRLEHVQRVMTLAFDLGTRVAIVQAGQVPDPEKERERFDRMTEGLGVLGSHGDRVGVALALETGLESGDVLAAFLDRFDSGGLGANLDPGNLLTHGFDPLAAIRALNRRIVHVHAKDARRASASRAAQEVPLGHGDVDWLDFVAVLAEIEYQGYLTVERETGDNRAADVAAGVAFLRRLVG
jgi:sugar phosphate isomerase/epimerase